jgi:glycosyltransferase involved in cell wall biosynthesis
MTAQPRHDWAADQSRSVSVVIPTHNRRVLLERTLTCVLAQQDCELEVLVVDDGSSDDTASFLDAHRDPRVSPIYVQTAGGVARARNLGLEQARHPWVAFLDDDDLWGPRRLGNQLNALHGSHAGWACSDAVLVDDRLTPLGVQQVPEGSDLSRDIFRTNLVPGGGSGVLAATELVREVGGFDPSCNPVEDWDLWIRLARAAPFVGVRRADVGYFLHSGSMSTNIARMTRGRDAVLTKYRAELAEQNLSYDYLWWEKYVLSLHLAAGNRRGAARSKTRLARRSSGLRHVLGIVPVLLAPKAVERRQRRRQLRDYDSALRDEAELWLAPLRPAPPGSPHAG